ncbi:hypothetical protein [Flagellimonas sp.]|uniref:hypothetical protein n=1 Tax=Flagellimonas sp. TaxID=2058762 RepID=UPI003B5BE876
MAQTHTFHIPVMGIGFTIDSPLKVSKFGIDSVISLVDDILIEKMRSMYCKKFKIPYEEITEKMEDFRAKRITSYLNLMKTLSEREFEEFRKTTTRTLNDINGFFDMLPDASSLKQEFKQLTKNTLNFNEIKDWFKANFPMGGIDVNIMTKVDKDNYVEGEKLPTEYNDAHAALRGFAMSDVDSSLVLSAGMNPRLYSYLSQFKEFYPDEDGFIKKKVILKVSDYRSAMIQGKFLAKKGIWISEFRIESGLNCGGHAFATEGYLLGPVLEEFKHKREELRQSLQEVLFQTLSKNDNVVPKTELKFKISAQGGVGTADEHQFLLEHYQVDSVGWGSPFLLVPEATTVDDATLNKLVDAKEEDVYLSDISPLGVPFNNLKGNTKDLEKMRLIEKGRPGSACPKKFVALNKEFTEKGICTASRQYQHLKIKALDKEDLPESEYQTRYTKIIEKACTCVGLGTSALLANDLETKTEGEGVSVCPGPNIAYFSKAMGLTEIINTIYGKSPTITSSERPNMFVKELNIYIDFLKKKLNETKLTSTPKQIKYVKTFANNLQEGLQYYNQLFDEVCTKTGNDLSSIFLGLRKSEEKLQTLNFEILKLGQ